MSQARHISWSSSQTCDSQLQEIDGFSCVVVFALGEARTAIWKLTGQFVNFRNVSILNLTEVISAQVKRI